MKDKRTILLPHQCWARIGQAGTVQTETLALFFNGMPKKYRRLVLVLTGRTVSDRAAARGFLGDRQR